MKPQAVSALLHATAFAAVVLLIESEARVPTAVTLFLTDVPAAVAPPAPVPAAPVKPTSAAPVVARAAPVRVGPPSSGPAPLIDLGLLALDGEPGDAPSNAVVIASGGAPGGVEGGTGGVVAPPPSKPPCPEVPPRPLTRVDVEYPAGAEGVAGRVVARAIVDVDGTVREVELLEPLSPQVDEAVREALRRWRFLPGRRCETAVESAFTVALRFELKD